MFARFLIALFYAGLFFALGAWSGGHLRPIGIAISEAAVVVAEGAETLWNRVTNAAPENPRPAAVASAPAAVPEATLTQARQDFARGDLNGAIARYRAYLVQHPADPDAWGELGNVHFNAGQTTEAARAYHAAALALLSEGRVDRARALEPAIRAAAPALADDLSVRLARIPAPAAVPIPAPIPAAARGAAG